MRIRKHKINAELRSQEPEEPLGHAERLAELKTYYDEITDMSEKLALASFNGDSSYAIKAIRDGADPNIVHGQTGMRALHLAASGGFADIVEALLETGACDLTIRDAQGRLPSDCAAYAAEDFALAERLAMIEAEQFHQARRDPRIGHYAE